MAPEALPAPAWVRPFETGVWLWCILVLNLTNLILSHRKWYHYGRVFESEAWGGMTRSAQVQLLARLALWVSRVGAGRG